MEQKLQIVAKKARNLARIMIYMLKKGISTGRLMAELNVLMKRGKLAGGKALHSLKHLHHISAEHRRGHDGNGEVTMFPVPVHEFEFSCCNAPAHHNHANMFSRAHAPPAEEEEEDELSVVATPALPGFGRTPVVRQLIVTDSPFPVPEAEEDNRVDEAAEEFISMFYRNLRRQNKTPA